MSPGVTQKDGVLRFGRRDYDLGSGEEGEFPQLSLETEEREVSVVRGK